MLHLETCPFIGDPTPQTVPPKYSRVRRETAIIGGLYTIILFIEFEHFVGVPSIRLGRRRRENVLKPSKDETTGMDTEHIMLCETSQREKSKYHTILLMCGT